MYTLSRQQGEGAHSVAFSGPRARRWPNGCELSRAAELVRTWVRAEAASALPRSLAWGQGQRVVSQLAFYSKS